jgi:hypothetical protein
MAQLLVPSKHKAHRLPMWITCGSRNHSITQLLEDVVVGQSTQETAMLDALHAIQRRFPMQCHRPDSSFAVMFLNMSFVWSLADSNSSRRAGSSEALKWRLLEDSVRVGHTEVTFLQILRTG